MCRGLAEVQLRCDLVRRRAAPFAHEQRSALVLGKCRQCRADVVHEARLCEIRLRERNAVQIELCVLLRVASRRPALRVADVARDRRQPRALALGDDTPAQRAKRVEKRRLHGILGVGATAQPARAETEEPLGVLLEQAACHFVGRNAAILDSY